MARLKVEIPGSRMVSGDVKNPHSDLATAFDDIATHPDDILTKPDSAPKRAARKQNEAMLNVLKNIGANK